MLRELSEEEMLKTVGGEFCAGLGSSHMLVYDVGCGGSGGGGGARSHRSTPRNPAVNDYGYPKEVIDSLRNELGEPSYNARRDDPELYILMVEDPHGFRPGAWTAPSSGWEGMR